MTELDDDRRAELVGSLGAVRSRIADACAAAGRDPHEVTLIAVTKTYPATDIATLARLGVLDIGESKDQEARGQGRSELAAPPCRRRSTLRWHLVGRLQTNKARSVVGYATPCTRSTGPKLGARAGRRCGRAASGPSRSTCSSRSASTTTPTAAASSPDELRRARRR